MPQLFYYLFLIPFLSQPAEYNWPDLPPAQSLAVKRQSVRNIAVKESWKEWKSHGERCEMLGVGQELWRFVYFFLPAKVPILDVSTHGVRNTLSWVLLWFLDSIKMNSTSMICILRHLGIITRTSGIYVFLKAIFTLNSATQTCKQHWQDTPISHSEQRHPRPQSSRALGNKQQYWPVEPLSA